MQKLLIFIVCLVSLAFSVRDESVFAVTQGSIYFKSDAPLELIEAKSNQLKGLLDPEDRTFAFTVDINSFQGFNSPLQREHFNENYLESSKYPKATYKGKIIENVNFSKPGEYDIRTKGIMNIHGVQQERIIKTHIKVQGNKITATSNFSVLLQEHNITIPKIVYQKIAEEIFVDIKAEFTKK